MSAPYAGRTAIAAIRAALVASLAVTATGCAGATIGSGVGDAFLEEAPYYAGRPATAPGTIAYLPVAYQPGASQPAMFDPEGGPGTPVADLLAAMTARLEARADGRLGPALEPVRGTPPDVQFGCEPDGVDDCLPRDAEWVAARGNPPMRLAVGLPSRTWSDAIAAALADAEADAVLVVTLEVGQYWPRQTNWRGSKEVQLGTGHVEALPWLTSLETPLTVLQLTGAVVDPDGRALRIGAEGLRARRTSIVLAGFGAQALISDADVAALAEARRDALPGQPLVWEAALDALLDGLLRGR